MVFIPVRQVVQSLMMFTKSSFRKLVNLNLKKAIFYQIGWLLLLFSPPVLSSRRFLRAIATQYAQIQSN